jgi:hypothetical protein
MSTVKTYNVDSGDTTSLSLKTNGTTAVTVNSSQNVGIGTTPSTGAVRVLIGGETTQFPVALSIDSTTHGTSTRASLRTGNWIVGQDNSGNGTRDFFIYDGGTAAATRFLITTTGFTGIGTAAPATTLHVNGTIRYTNRPATGTITAIGFDANGDLRASSSSLRYKYDIQDYGKGLAEVMQLRPVSFKFNGEERTNIGYIAEEVDALGLSEVMLYDDEGQPEGVLYANMVSLLTKAIQELNAKVEAQAAEIAALKGVQ